MPVTAIMYDALHADLWHSWMTLRFLQLQTPASPTSFLNLSTFSMFLKHGQQLIEELVHVTSTAITLCCSCAAWSNMECTTGTTCWDASLVSCHFEMHPSSTLQHKIPVNYHVKGFINMHKIIHENLSRVTRPSLLSFVSPCPLILPLYDGTLFSLRREGLAHKTRSSYVCVHWGPTDAYWRWTGQ